MREAVPEVKSKNGALKMSKATLIATLMAVVSAFSSPAKAQAPLKTKPATKSDQPTYMITAHTVVHDDSTNSQLDNYTIVSGLELLKVQYAESQISTVKPGAPLLEQLAPGKGLHLHFRYGVWPQEPDVSQVPHVGVPVRACEMDTKYPDSDGHPVIAIQSVTAPCMARTGDDTLHYVLAPNGGLNDLGYVNFDILEVTHIDLSAGLVPRQVAPAPTGPSANVGVAAAQSAPPRKDIPAIAKAANGAIVSIVMSDKDGHAIAQGSGFLISRDGRIVTNYHVIAEGNSAVVRLPDGAFYVVDGVLAFDKARDVAVIKAHGENFRTLILGNSDQLQVGEEVVAIGNPLSLESTVSNGIVSGIRTVKEEGGKFVQVTTPISPGSSGGPLFNMAGEVVGITTLYLKGGENLNFAIPINDVKGLLPAESSKIQALPNETEPVKAQTHDGDAPSSVASPPVQPPVEHAATAEQCEADARVWMSHHAVPATVNVLRYTELQTRVQEMADCYVVGAQDELSVRKNVRYIYMEYVYEWDEIVRMAHYIARHDAWSQYMPEHVPLLSITEEPPEQAPAPKQCKADERVWNQQIQAGMFDKLSVNELYVRPQEMANCANRLGADFLAAATFNGYFSTAVVYNAIAVERLRAYLLRHNETSQFLSEDAAGVR